MWLGAGLGCGFGVEFGGCDFQGELVAGSVLKDVIVLRGLIANAAVRSPVELVSEESSSISPIINLSLEIGGVVSCAMAWILGSAGDAGFSCGTENSLH